MKLTEMHQIGGTPEKVEGGKAAISFAGYLSDMEKHFAASQAQKLRQLAAHLIKSGFSFGKIPNTIFGNMGFFKGEMIVHLPVKAQNKKSQNRWLYRTAEVRTTTSPWRRSPEWTTRSSSTQWLSCRRRVTP